MPRNKKITAKMRKDNWLAPVTRTNQVLELSDKDFKATVRKMLQQAITNSLETKKIEVSTKKKLFWKRTKWKLWN